MSAPVVFLAVVHRLEIEQGTEGDSFQVCTGFGGRANFKGIGEEMPNVVRSSGL